MGSIHSSAKPRLRPDRKALLRYAVRFLLLLLAFYAGGRLGYLLTGAQPGATPLWPPTGIAIAALALWGPRMWPAVAVGGFLVNFNLAGDLPSSLGIAAGNAAEALLGAAWLRRLGRARAFESPRGFLAFLAYAAAATAVSALAGMLSLLAAGLAEPARLPLIGLTWWVGNLMSAWALVPFLVLAVEAWKRPGRARPAPGRVAEAVAVAAAVLGANLLVFGGVLPEPHRAIPVAFSTLPPILWAAYRFGRLGAAAAVVGQTVVAGWGTARGYGQFATQGHSFLLLQMFLATGLVSFQLLAVVGYARRRAVDRLAESERRMDSIVRSVPGMVWESMGEPQGLAHRYTYVSGQSQQLLGYSPEEWMERRDLWIACVHPDDCDRAAREASETFAGTRTGASRVRCVARDGKPVDVEIRAAVVRDARGNPVGMRGFSMDVSDRRRAEEKLRATEEQLRQAQKMEAVGRLAGGVAHDFNNLLTAVNGYSDLLVTQLGEAHPLREFAVEIRGAGERAAALTRQLLAFSRKEVVQPRVLDLNHLVSDLQKLLGRLIGEDIGLRTSLDPALLRVKADPDQVGQILLNLVVNARDAMGRGGELVIETANVRTSGEDPGFYLKPAPGAYVRLTVRDSGTGMDAETLGHLFEPFFTTKDRGRGTGLGLSTVYGILERLAGGVRVESSLGSGSAFHAYIPALPEGAGPGFARRAEAFAPEAGPGEGASVPAAAEKAGASPDAAAPGATRGQP